MTCCFFGHKDTPHSIRGQLEKTLIDLIENKGVDCFLVGNQGSFDAMAQGILKELKLRYPEICYSVVLAYVPGTRKGCGTAEPDHTLLPEGIELVPPRFAITWRNKWMVRASDVVVAYVAHDWGGAAQFVAYARRQNKQVVNLAE